MAEYVCNQQCQAKFNDTIKLCEVGRTYPKPNKEALAYFTEIGGEDHRVDFLTASAEELLASDWKSKDAAAFLQAAFNIKMRKFDGMTKKDVVDQILDAKYRNDAPKLPGTTL